MELFSHLKSKKNSQRGVALVAVMIILGILIIIALAFYALGAYEAGLYERRRELEVAFCRAESGVERARWVLVKTQSKSKALIDSAGINVYEVVELDPSGQPTRLTEPLIDFFHHVRVRSQGIEKGQVRELVAEFAPGLLYAVACAQHITFYGASNDWSQADVIDHVNDVYIDGGLLYDHHINHPDWPWKYDWALPDTINLPDFLTNMAEFRNYFLPPLADTTFLPPANLFFGRNSATGVWENLPDHLNRIFVQGSVDISGNVRQSWDSTSVDVAIFATGDITVSKGMCDDDDRLILVAKNNVIFEDDPPGGSINAVVLAGNRVITQGITNPGGNGGEGTIAGMVYVCYHIEMRGNDESEIYPFRRGWKVVQRLDTILLNGGIPFLPITVADIFNLRRISWAEVPPV